MDSEHASSPQIHPSNTELKQESQKSEVCHQSVKMIQVAQVDEQLEKKEGQRDKSLLSEHGQDSAPLIAWQQNAQAQSGLQSLFT
jgi:hypothetical protein